MTLPKFGYATVEFINTWHYAEGGAGGEGTMAIVRLHSSSAADVEIALFAQGPRHQNAFENLFATKAKFGFTVQKQESDPDLVPLIPKGFKPGGDGPCDSQFGGAYTARAIFYPICS